MYYRQGGSVLLRPRQLLLARYASGQDYDMQVGEFIPLSDVVEILHQTGTTVPINPLSTMNYSLTFTDSAMTATIVGTLSTMSITQEHDQKLEMLGYLCESSRSTMVALKQHLLSYYSQTPGGHYVEKTEKQLLTI
jgi:hypothetical protein